ncbi:MAG: 5'/3'-nucleotidase SurE [Bacteroidales bacterium]
MTKDRPTILVTNDDGITAPGIRKLIEIMHRIGDVTVVAPDKPQSGMSHAVTVAFPLMLHQIQNENRHLEFSCTGTSVDCVKMGIKVVLGRKPDLVVSGINHGNNASVNVLYSGTMAAAMDAAMENIPAIGFSLDNYSLNTNFDGFEKHIETITRNVLKNGLPPYTCLNVNIPDIKPSEIKGVKIVRQGKGNWVESFDGRIDPHNRNYYWLTGHFVGSDNNEDTDTWALNNNYIAVVPIHIDLTAHHAIDKLAEWDFSHEP